MLFEPLPTAGTSGGPIVDEETGAVVGVILGTRMDNRVEGVRGWGSPAESIFEVSLLRNNIISPPDLRAFLHTDVQPSRAERQALILPSTSPCCVDIISDWEAPTRVQILLLQGRTLI